MGKQAPISPLVQQLAAVRKAHSVSQLTLEMRMLLPVDTIRHIERGRRPLPDLHKGLVEWVKRYLECVGATSEERDRIVLALHADVLSHFSVMLDAEAGVEASDEYVAVPVWQTMRD